MKSFTKIFRDWLSEPQPAIQSPHGLAVDADFNPPEPGFWGTLLGRGSDGRIYELDSVDARRLRPVVLRDERAIRNERLKAERLARRPRPAVIILGGDDAEPEPALPRAKILPAGKRPVPDFVDWDDIAMPPRGAGDGGHDK
jgi:hypothetical protein